MDVVVKSRHCSVPDQFRSYVDEKITRLEKLDDRVIRCRRAESFKECSTVGQRVIERRDVRNPPVRRRRQRRDLAMPVR